MMSDITRSRRRIVIRSNKCKRAFISAVVSMDTIQWLLVGAFVILTTGTSVVSFRRLRGGCLGCALVSCIMIGIVFGTQWVYDGFLTPFWPIGIVAVSQFTIAIYWVSWFLYKLYKKGAGDTVGCVRQMRVDQPKDNSGDPY